MKKYRIKGVVTQKLFAHNLLEAAVIYVGRKTRADFGRLGTYKHLQKVSESKDGSAAEFTAFIGKPSKYEGSLGELMGRDIYFTVMVESTQGMAK